MTGNGRPGRLTTGEYLAGDESRLPQELVWGVVRDAPAPHPRHQRAVFRLAGLLDARVRAHDLREVLVARVDVILDEARALVVQPDIVFMAKARLALVSDRIRGVPDLIVEVLSPRPRIGQLGERITWFATYGVKECWLVHQLSASVEVVEFALRRIASRRRFGAHQTIASRVLPGFSDAFADFVPEQA